MSILFVAHPAVLDMSTGVVGCGEGVMYFMSQGWGVQLILAYSWAKPAILVAGKGRGEC